MHSVMKLNGKIYVLTAFRETKNNILGFLFNYGLMHLREEAVPPVDKVMIGPLQSL